MLQWRPVVSASVTTRRTEPENVGVPKPSRLSSVGVSLPADSSADIAAGDSTGGSIAVGPIAVRPVPVVPIAIVAVGPIAIVIAVVPIAAVAVAPMPVAIVPIPAIATGNAAVTGFGTNAVRLMKRGGDMARADGINNMAMPRKRELVIAIRVVM